MSYDTSIDILNAALFDASERQDSVSDYYEPAKRYINSVYQDLMDSSGALFDGVNPLKEDWPFLIKGANLILEPPISNLSVTVTAGSQNVTFSSTVSQSLTGWHLKVDGNDDVFIIASHTAGSYSATLDTIYTGGPSGTFGCRIMKLDYALPGDFKRLADPFRINILATYRQVLTGIDLKEFHERYPLSLITIEIPTHFTLLHDGKVRFNGVGRLDGVYTRVDYRYVFRPPKLAFVSEEEPIIPKEYRSILANAATYQILLSKNDDRAIVFYRMAQTRLANMVDDFRRIMLAGSELEGKLAASEIIMTPSGIIFN